MSRIDGRGRTPRALTLVAALAAALAGTTAVAHGQEQPRERVSERAVGARPAAERLAQAVQERLGLTAEQSRRLRDATARFAGERQRLLRQERSLRRDLREELGKREDAQQERVGRMLDSLLGLHQQRAELVSAEQRALAEFMTPVQRAEFLALQERAFRAAQQVRSQHEGRAGGRPAPRGDGTRPR